MHVRLYPNKEEEGVDVGNTTVTSVGQQEEDVLSVSSGGTIPWKARVS